MLKQYERYFLIALAALIMTVPAFINGFPFIFIDTIDYLIGQVRIFRPPAYSTFAVIGRTLGNIWFVPIVQGLIVGYVLYYLNKVIWGRVNKYWFVFQICFLTIFSSLPYFSAFIIADIFTPILFLTFFILVFFRDQLERRTKIYMTLLFVFSSMAHVSNIYLGLGLLMLSVIIEFLRGGLRKNLKNNNVVAGGLVFAILSLTLVNVVFFKSVSLSPSAPTFMLANMIAQGPAKKYIQTTCPQSGYKICRFAGTLNSDVNQFIWHTDGVVYNLGGFQAFNNEAKLILKNTLISYPQDVVKVAFNAFVKSFSVHTPGVEIDDGAYKERFPEFSELYFGKAAKQQFLNSAQTRGVFPHEILKAIDAFIYPFTLLVLVISTLVFIPKYRDNRYLLPIFTLAFICGNNFLCAFGSGLFDRYQARVSWLMVLAFTFIIGFTFNRVNGRQNSLSE